MTTVLLPVLFAACSEMDLEEGVNTPAQQQDGRRTVENVKLNFITDSPSTRMYYDNGYKWEENDMIGACQMDEILYENYGNEDYPWDAWFNLVNYVNTNYPFTRDGEGNWTTQAKLSEGNYFFCYPYDKNMGNRKAYVFKLNKQVVTGNNAEGMARAFAENNAFVGFNKVRAGDEPGESLDVYMVPVFGATRITLVNNTSMTVDIQKVVLRGDEVKGALTLDPTNATPAVQYTDEVKNKGYTSTVGNATAARTASNFVKQSGSSKGDAWFNVDQYVGDEDGRLYDPEFGEDYSRDAAIMDIIAEVPNDQTAVEVVFDEGVGTLKNGEKLNFVVMSVDKALTPGNGHATMYVYTDRGLMNPVELNTHYTNATASNYGILTDKALNRLGHGESVKVEFDVNSLEAKKEMNVYSEDEMLKLIEWRKNTADDATAILPGDFTITKAIADALMAEDCQITKLNIKKLASAGNITVTLASGVDQNVLNKMNFEDTTGSDEVHAVKIEGTIDLTDEYGTEFTPAIVVAENGTLNVNAKGDATAFDLKAALTNNGTVKVAGNVKISDNTLDSKNNGTLEVSGTLEMGQTGHKMINNKQMTVEKGGEVKGDGSVENAAGATLTNNGTIKTVSANKEAVTVAPKKAAGVINNYGTITGVTSNKGKIYNSSLDSIAKSDKSILTVATNDTDGEVYVYGKAGTTVTANTNGSVIVTHMDPDSQRLKVTDGNVVQEVTTGNFDIEKRLKNVNMLWMTKTGASLLASTTKDYSSGTELSVVVKAGIEVGITGKAGSEELTLKALTVQRNTVLTIGKLKSFTVSGAVFETTDEETKVDADHPATINIEGTVTDEVTTSAWGAGSGGTVNNYSGN